MDRRLVGALSLSLLISACSDKPALTPTEPQFQIGTGPACKPSTLQKYARDLFGANSAGLTAAKKITNQNANTAQGTNFGFDVADLMEQLIDAGHAGGTWTAAKSLLVGNLSVQLIACMDVSVSGALSVAAFTRAADLTGLFAVPDAQTTSILSHDGLVGVQPSVDFPSWLSGRSWFYGSPTTSNSVELFGGYAFDVSVVRPIVRPATTPPPLNGLGVVAMCSDGSLLVPPQPDAQIRVEAHHVILPIADGSFVPCAPPSAFGLEHGWGPSLLVKRLVRWGTGLFQPRPLYAATALLTVSKGGRVDAFSTHVLSNPGALIMTYVSQPTNAGANEPIPGATLPDVAVKVTGQNGTPWEGVHIKIIGITNNGENNETCNGEADTGSDGIAHFPDIAISKPGGNILLASTVPATNDPDVTAFASASVESDHINIGPSTLPDCTLP